MRWLLDRDRLARLSAPNRTWRLQVLTTVIDQHPQRDALRERLSAVWKHGSAVRLLAEMGLPDQTSFVKEAVQRLTDRLLPQVDPHEDLYALFDRLNLTEADAAWLEQLPDEVRGRWAAIFEPSARSLATAAELLAVRAAALGLSRELLLRQPGVSELDSPFFRLPQAARELVQNPGDAAKRETWAQARAGCEGAVAAAHSRLTEHGVSVELVFRLDLVRATLARIDALLELAVGHGGGGFALAVELVRGSASQHSLRGLLRATMRGLALKVVEHTAQTGEHSIATTRAEWWAMLRSASRGGALTSVTAFLKYALATLPLAPGLMGGAMALNYSISFIVLQFLGFSLASKQPSMTGSALADALDQKNGLGAEIDLVASIARTQLIAAIGNVCVAIPAALLLDLAWRAISGHPLLNATQAEHGLVDLHPPRSDSAEERTVAMRVRTVPASPIPPRRKRGARAKAWSTSRTRCGRRGSPSAASRSMWQVHMLSTATEHAGDQLRRKLLDLEDVIGDVAAAQVRVVPLTTRGDDARRLPELQQARADKVTRRRTTPIAHSSSSRVPLPRWARRKSSSPPPCAAALAVMQATPARSTGSPLQASRDCNSSAAKSGAAPPRRQAEPTSQAGAPAARRGQSTLRAVAAVPTPAESSAASPRRPACPRPAP